MSLTVGIGDPVHDAYRSDGGPDTTPSPTATIASQTISAGTHQPNGTITRFTIE
jgi:hypothetical protein